MKNFILALLLLQSGPQAAGVVTGMVHGPNGMPAAGVRVFAVEARDGIDAAKTPVALESISVTDESGRYRMEIAAGRYYIASGSVDSPTYAPGTPDIAGALAVRITGGTVIENVDFSSFVPATRTIPFILQRPPGSTGVLSGVIHYPDGTPASRMVVIVMPSPLSAGGRSVSPNSSSLLGQYVNIAISDSNGSYRINNVTPGTYVIAAGTAEAPTFYPGT
ncbi:MAG TPA: hypothetical protein VFO86_10475, partial [Terriglobia bacterium]|nr:hypothetical protein [Terriglobia bacterium]